MEHWGFTLVFIFSLLVIIRNILVFARRLFDAEPITYELKRDELLLLGCAFSYTLTYLIY